MAYNKCPGAISSSAMIASPHYSASQAGAEILSEGGSAVDAAIAANAVLCVVYPHMCGLGGDLFAQVWDPVKKQLLGLNASGKSSINATIEFFYSRGLNKIDLRGPLSAITVPGVVNGWKKLHNRFGKLNWEHLFQPSIKLAAGYNITKNLGNSIAENIDTLKLSKSGFKTFTSKGKPLQACELLTLPDLGKSIKQISKHGADVFYAGKLGETILDNLHERGGILTKSDFLADESEWVFPITSLYKEYTIAEIPPNSQGLVLLLMLNILKNINWKKVERFSAEYFHIFTEVFKAVLPDRETWITDPSEVKIPLNEILSDSYGLAKFQQIDFKKAAYRLENNDGTFNGDTVYLCATDSNGLVISLIQSIFLEFGSGIMIPDTGILLQNRGSAFSLDKRHPNHLSPCKRTFHTLMPTMVFKENEPCYAIGTMGGEGQPQTIASVLINLFEYNDDLQEAINAPRWFYGRLPGDSERVLYLESRIPNEVAIELTRMGHVVGRLEDFSKFMGHCQAIYINKDQNILIGTADPRSDGIAIGI